MNLLLFQNMTATRVFLAKM